MKYVMYTLVQIEKGQHAFACHKTFKMRIHTTTRHDIMSHFMQTMHYDWPIYATPHAECLSRSATRVTILINWPITD